MDWSTRLFRFLRGKYVRGINFPKANLPSTLLNMAARGFQPRHIIDVGAHKSRWSQDARIAFPDAAFTLIEPQAELASYLRRFCDRQPNSRYFIAGAGSQMGELPFTVCPDKSASNFVTSSDDAARSGLPQRTVPILTIDHLVETIGLVPDIIKVDAEGFEQEVIHGASSVVGQTEVIFLEAHFYGHDGNPSDFATLVLFMAERDYVPYDFTWFGKRSDDGSLFLCEIAFALRHGFLRTGKHPAIAKPATQQRKAA
jgi:FkbM family methyltransferase